MSIKSQSKPESTKPSEQKIKWTKALVQAMKNSRKP